MTRRSRQFGSGLATSRASAPESPSDAIPGNEDVQRRQLGAPLALGLITLAGLALRLWRLDFLSLRGDEAFSVLYASQRLLDVVAGLRVTEPHPPIYYVGLSFWMRVFGDSEWSVRAPSVVFGAMLIPLTYWLASPVVRRQVALLAACLVAINPLLIWQSQDARMYTIFPTLAIASLGFALRLTVGGLYPSSVAGLGAATAPLSRPGADPAPAGGRPQGPPLPGKDVDATGIAGAPGLGKVTSSLHGGRDTNADAIEIGGAPRRGESPTCPYTEVEDLDPTSPGGRPQGSALHDIAPAAGRDAVTAPLLLLGLIVSSALMLLSHYAALYVVFAENAVALGAFLFAWRSTRSNSAEADGVGSVALRRFGLAWTLSQIVVALICAPWYYYAREVVLGRRVAWIEPTPILTVASKAWADYVLGPSIGLGAGFALSLAFAMAAVIGVFVAARGRRQLPITMYAALPVAAAGMTSLTRPVFVDRYFVFVVPLICILVASGALAGRGWRRAAPVLCLAIALGATAYSLQTYFFDSRTFKSPDWRGLVAYLGASHHPGDALIVNSPDPALRYYTRHIADLTTVTLPSSVPIDRNATERALTDLASQDRQLWHVPVRDLSWDANGLVEGWLDTYTFPTKDRRFEGLNLRLFATPLAMLDAHPRPAPSTFGDAIQLLGYDFSADSSPGSPEPHTFHPGDEIWLMLYFRGTKPIGQDLTVFNHLVGEGDKTWGQHDGAPVDQKHPTLAWAPGEIVVDRHRIPIGAEAPDGSYRVLVGFYSPETGRRLPVHGSDGQAAGDVVVIAGITISR